jgi:phenylpropionate dioxygenase-like ring-hydroxylating dioxygenase large terminal subunit
MFEGFARVWTPVAMSSELRAGKPLAVRVAGTPVVLFRGRDGAPAALVDRCPHRGVALSLGKVKDGCIECPFHGWQLDASGKVCHVPWNPDAKLAALGGVSLPVVERAGQVWIFTSAGEAPRAAPEVHEAFLREDIRIIGLPVEWKTHWTRAMENMLDWPHLPFIHAATIGRGMTGKHGARMDIAWEPRPWGAHSTIRIDGAEQPGSLDFRWPNQMNLFVPIPGRTMILAVTCVPLDADRTQLILVMGRDFLKWSALDRFFHRTNLKIAREDQAVVESSFPAEIPPAREEQSVRTDALTLHFRKRYYAELRGSTAASPGPRALPVIGEARAAAS